MQRQAQRREHASHKCIRSQEQQSTAFVSLPSAARLECIRTDCCGRHGANAPMWAAKRPTARCCDLCGRRNTDAQPALLSDGNGGRGLCRAGCVTYSRVYCCDSLSACLPACPPAFQCCVCACVRNVGKRWSVLVVVVATMAVDGRCPIDWQAPAWSPARAPCAPCVCACGRARLCVGWLAGWQAVHAVGAPTAHWAAAPLAASDALCPPSQPRWPMPASLHPQPTEAEGGGRPCLAVFVKPSGRLVVLPRIRYRKVRVLLAVCVGSRCRYGYGVCPLPPGRRRLAPHGSL